MILKNATVYLEDFEPHRVDLRIDGEYIAQIGDALSGEDVVDLSGKTIFPGFIDIHIHGCAGADFCDANPDSLHAMSRRLSEHGVTSFCPASMTLPREDLERQFRAAALAMGTEPGAYIHGINMEGPYIADAQRGAQPAAFIRPPDLKEFRHLQSLCKVCLVDLAPETEGAFAFAREVAADCTVSQAHTDATFDIAAEGYRNGFSHATHLFSAMPPIYHRAPGAVCAAFDHPTVTAELICDGIHAHQPVLRMAFRLLGEDRAVVVSDAMSAAGCGDGEYALGGQKVIVKDGRATLESGNLAGSTTNMHTEFLNLLNFGIPFRSALKACTVNPARVIGVSGLTGSIAPGKRADLLAVDASMQIHSVYVKGSAVYTA